MSNKDIKSVKVECAIFDESGNKIRDIECKDVEYDPETQYLKGSFPESIEGRYFRFKITPLYPCGEAGIIKVLTNNTK